MTADFDAQTYKETTREQWQATADAWLHWHPTLQEWLGSATDVLLDMAGIDAGGRVLDIAAGAGQQSLQAASRVGRSGSVLATDISPNILDLAAREAEAAGMSNLETQVMDAEHLDLPDESFDAVISRLGFMYLPSLQTALAGMRRVLKPSGRIAAMVFSTPEKNEFFSLPVSIIRRRAHLPAPVPGQPGPFSLGGSGVLEAAYLQAGFRDPEVRALDAPLRMRSAKECVRFERESFGALQQMLAGLSESEREATWQEIEAALRTFESQDGFIAPCEILIGAAKR
jgi:SAM-dependent methyltransferase